MGKSGAEYRVVRYYNTFFAHHGYLLQKKRKILGLEIWTTVEDDALGIHGYEWSKHFNCPIIEKDEEVFSGDWELKLWILVLILVAMFPFLLWWAR